MAKLDNTLSTCRLFLNIEHNGTLLDTSPLGQTATLIGTPSVSTAGLVHTNGVNQGISYNNSTYFTLGTGMFTMIFDVNITTDSSYYTGFSGQGGTGSKPYFYFVIDASTGITMGCRNGGYNTSYYYRWADTIERGKRTRIELCRNDTNVYLFLDGVLKTTFEGTPWPSGYSLNYGTLHRVCGTGQANGYDTDGDYKLLNYAFYQGACLYTATHELDWFYDASELIPPAEPLFTQTPGSQLLIPDNNLVLPHHMEILH